MGVVNVTPDSFSDGGDHDDPDRAVAHGLGLLAQGADILDIGGESTRPGAKRTPEDVELARVVGVVEALCRAGAVVSVDTMRARVARAAVAVGACMVNDVSGGLADPDMLGVVAESGACYVVTHWPQAAGQGAGAPVAATVDEVARQLAQRVDAALSAGVAAERIVVDPGLGFAKTSALNWALLARLDALWGLGFPLLVGASRKRFLGELLADETGPRPPLGRDDATLAITALAAARGVWGVRTHTVRAQRDAIAVAEAMTGAHVGGISDDADRVLRQGC